MAEATREEVIVWVLESAGLHMRADTTEAGKLVRLADVVRRLMLVNELPRVEAVEALCTALEAAPVPPELFRAYSGRRAELLEGDAALFGFHTEETWAASQIERETLERMHREPWYFDFRDRDDPSIDRGPPSELSASAKADIRARVQRGERPSVTHVGERQSLLCDPGVPAAVRYIRERWPTAPRRRFDGTTARDVLDDPLGRAFGLSIRLSDAQALWGRGTTAQVIQLVTEFADEEPKRKRASPEWTGERLVKKLIELRRDRVPSPVNELARLSGLSPREVHRRRSEYTKSVQKSVVSQLPTGKKAGAGSRR